MILIQKNSEPDSLREHRNTPGADFDGLDKTELRDSLLKEQGYLCAYCMKRIRQENKVKIEHYKARNKENELLYQNLLAVCDGNETLAFNGNKVNPQRFTCDTRKKEQELHINPQDKNDMETIFYDNQGKIYSQNPDYQKEIDDVLNLNDPYGYLISNRIAALEPLLKRIHDLKPGQDAMPLLRKVERYCYSKNDMQEYPEYVGILRWYVKRQIRRRG